MFIWFQLKESCFIDETSQPTNLTVDDSDIREAKVQECGNTDRDRDRPQSPTSVFFLLRLKALDLVTMKKLDSKVNIIPVIAKADTITKSELNKFKAKVNLNWF